MALGCTFVIAPIYSVSYVTSFPLFFFLYACVLGFGFGLMYMLPIKNAWLFFPEKKGMISGIILSCYSLGAIAWSFLTMFLANPNNVKSIAVPNGNTIDHLYMSDSEVVHNVPQMFRVISYIFVGMGVLCVLLTSKK